MRFAIKHSISIGKGYILVAGYSSIAIINVKTGKIEFEVISIPSELPVSEINALTSPTIMATPINIKMNNAIKFPSKEAKRFFRKPIVLNYNWQNYKIF